MTTNQATRNEKQESGNQRIGIIGEGKMGSGIFNYLLDFPFTLRWACSPAADIPNLQKSLEKKLRRSLKAGLINQVQQDEILNRTIISTDLQELKDCDLVIETVNEDIGLKRELFSKLDPILSPACIMASNSSSINPSRLIAVERRGPFTIGLHFFYPVALKETVELIVTGDTDEEVRDKTIRFLEEIDKNVLLLKESNSFILNRLFLDVQNEAWHIIAQGKASLPVIDDLVTKDLFPFGLFDFMDKVGIDTMLESVKNYTEGYPHRDYYLPLIEKLTSLVAEGKLGKESGEGFHRYENGIRQVPEKTEKLPEAAEKEILDYLRYTYLNSAKRFTMQSGCTIDEMNDAIKEYFGLDRGPFE